jgi:hypothetical protein
MLDADMYHPLSMRRKILVPVEKGDALILC